MKKNKIMKNVIVLGKGSLCIQICDWFKSNTKFNISLVVPVIPEPKWTDSLMNWCEINKIKTLKSGDYRNINDDILIESDLVISVFYDKIIKSEFINKCKKIINLHNGPLPKYRGVSPINWALKNNEMEHGVTIHEISPGIDDGNIIGQVKYSIYSEFDEVIDVYNRANDYAFVLFKNTIVLIDKINPRKQDNSKSSYYSKNENHLLKERANFTKSESK